jgi:NADPH:quinone reductase-like Zn-dependent oxidoreductase
MYVPLLYPLMGALGTSDLNTAVVEREEGFAGRTPGRSRTLLLQPAEGCLLEWQVARTGPARHSPSCAVPNAARPSRVAPAWAFGALVRLDLSARDTLAVFSVGPVGMAVVQLAAAMGAGRSLSTSTKTAPLHYTRSRLRPEPGHDPR